MPFGVNHCRYCNKDLSGYTDEYARKHVLKCSTHIKPKYVYSDRKRGRPSKKEVQRIMEERNKDEEV